MYPLVKACLTSVDLCSLIQWTTPYTHFLMICKKREKTRIVHSTRLPTVDRARIISAKGDHQKKKNQLNHCWKARNFLIPLRFPVKNNYFHYMSIVEIIWLIYSILFKYLFFIKWKQVIIFLSMHHSVLSMRLDMVLKFLF